MPNSTQSWRRIGTAPGLHSRPAKVPLSATASAATSASTIGTIGSPPVPARVVPGDGRRPEAAARDGLSEGVGKGR